MYARSDLNNDVHVSNPVDAERSWHYLHTDRGSVLVGNMYRPPDASDIVIESLRSEIAAFDGKVVGVLLFGDFNVHHRKWLRFSSGNTAVGEAFARILSGIIFAAIC